MERHDKQPWDAQDYFDPLRYGTWANDDYTVNKVQETYSHNNRVVYNFENRSVKIFYSFRID